MSCNYGRGRNRLRKGKRGMNSFYQKSLYGYGQRATYCPFYNKHRRRTPEWGALDRAWVGYVIAKSEDGYEKMRKYAKIKCSQLSNKILQHYLDKRKFTIVIA